MRLDASLRFYSVYSLVCTFIRLNSRETNNRCCLLMIDNDVGYENLFRAGSQQGRRYEREANEGEEGSVTEKRNGKIVQIDREGERKLKRRTFLWPLRINIWCSNTHTQNTYRNICSLHAVSLVTFFLISSRFFALTMINIIDVFLFVPDCASTKMMSKKAAERSK